MNQGTTSSFSIPCSSVLYSSSPDGGTRMPTLRSALRHSRRESSEPPFTGLILSYRTLEQIHFLNLNSLFICSIFNCPDGGTRMPTLRSALRHSLRESSEPPFTGLILSYRTLEKIH